MVSLGATGTTICPVSALLDYLTVRGSQEGALFINEDSSPEREVINTAQHKGMWYMILYIKGGAHEYLEGINFNYLGDPSWSLGLSPKGNLVVKVKDVDTLSG